jgi:hypothetical protein
MIAFVEDRHSFVNVVHIDSDNNVTPRLRVRMR